MTVAEQHDSMKSQKPAEEFKMNAVVFVLLTRRNGDKRELLFQLRTNTSYMANMYDFSASGKIDPGESVEMAAVREAFEEACVVIDPNDLHLFHMRHETSENHLKIFFWTENWTVDGIENGEPKIGEPEKCGDLLWTTYHDLPENLIPFLRKVLYYGIVRELYSDDLSDNTPDGI